MRWNSLLLVMAVALAMPALTACSAPATLDALPTADGAPVRVPVGIQTTVTVQPPKGVRVVDPQSWVWQLGQDRAILLRVQQNPEPDGGVKAFFDSQIEALNREGSAGIERDEVVMLGDLEARLVQAVELRGQPATALWLIVTGAEDGMYIASAAAPIDVMRSKSKEVLAFLTSLRIQPPAGVTRNGAPVRMNGDDVTPPDDATPSASSPSPPAGTP